MEKLGLRLAWTQIVTGEDYEEHMAAVGQAQAAAALTQEMIRDAGLRAGARVTVAGAGTGQMFDFLDPALFRPLTLICTDLNPKFLIRLRERLVRDDLKALIFADDIEHTALPRGADLILIALLLEQINWRKGVEVIAGLRPAACGIVIQENPAGMTSAVTPGRRIPASMAAAFEKVQPKLVPHDELVKACEARGFRCAVTKAREVADGKRLLSVLMERT